MSGRGVRVYSATLLRVSPYVLTVLLVAYVGGPSLVVLIGSVLLTAAALQRSAQFRSGLGVLAALVVNLAWLMIYVGTILPQVLRVPGLRLLAARSHAQVGFEAIAYPARSVGFFWLGSLLILGIPGIVSGIVLVRGRTRYKPFSQPLLGRLAWLSGLVPFALVALLKWFEPWRALAFTMSGDGRNHLLLIEGIRFESSVSLSPFTLTTPRLSNAIGALLSSGNGSSGTLQSGDLWAMLAVYVLSASILIVATVTGFVTAVAVRGKTPWMVLPLVGAAFLLATNSFVLSTSLKDGFMSLYFGTAVLGTSLVLAAILPVGRTKVLVLICGVVSLIGAYSFLAPVLGVVLVVEVYRWFWTVESRRRRAVAVVGWSLLIVAGGVVAVRRNWNSFEVIAAMYGAITPVDSGVLWILLALAITLWVTCKAEPSAAGFTGSVALVASLFVLFLIERIPANSGEGFSYYGSKTIVGTVGGVLCLSFVPLGSLLSTASPKRIRRLVATAGLTAGALVPFAIAEEASSLPRPWSAIREGWANPDASSIEGVVGRWGDDPYLFFRFDDNPPIVQYPSVGADRLLNFWTPTTWSSEGAWAAMWNWVYLEMSSLDASVLCTPIRVGVQTIYTRDPLLQGQVQDACGPSDVHFVVLPRESSP